MRYIMKAGILYNDDALAVLARVKSSLVGPLKKIDDNKGQLLLEADIRCLDQIKSSSGDVRNREYVLIDPEGKVVASARPGYAKGDEPDVVGWPICRMPRVDNAKLNINGTEYFLVLLPADGPVLSIQYPLLRRSYSLHSRLSVRVLQNINIPFLFPFCSYRLYKFCKNRQFLFINSSRKCNMRQLIKCHILRADRAIQWIRHNAFYIL